MYQSCCFPRRSFDQSVDYHHQWCGRHNLRRGEIPPESGLPRGLPDQAASDVLLTVSTAAEAPGEPTPSPVLFVEIEVAVVEIHRQTHATCGCCAPAKKFIVRKDRSCRLTISGLLVPLICRQHYMLFFDLLQLDSEFDLVLSPDWPHCVTRY